MKISFVIPAYNEEGNVSLLAGKIIAEVDNLFDYEMISTDNTLQILKLLNKNNPKIHYISFSRNFGHQNALKAGIDYANGDCVISMDADLQHPPSLIRPMIDKWLKGYHIVYTTRGEDNDLGFLKRKTSKIFYELINFLSNIKIETGTADFRLMDKKVIDIIKNTSDSPLFLRGLIPRLRFKRYKIVYQPDKRYSGATKYTPKKMFLLALYGITSFSVKPLRCLLIIGAAISFLSFCYGIYAIFIYFFTKKTVLGWTPIICSILFVGGLQLFVLGIIGEYLRKLFIQAKNRPFYVVEEQDKFLTQSPGSPLPRERMKGDLTSSRNM